MNEDLPDWKRDHYQRGEGRALIYYVVYGEFTNDVTISRSKYRSAGLPTGFKLSKLDRKQQDSLPFTDGAFGKGVTDKELFERIGHAPECMQFYGDIPDPENLNYLRDSVGIVSFLLDHGGFAVCDPQQLELYNRERWQRTIFDGGATNLLKLVKILYSDEADGRWYHTRGLRKFARPDLSVRGVPGDYSNAVIDLCNRFIQLQQLGGKITDGQEIRIASLPGGLVCHHAGSLEDPDFNNVHVEIQWPAK